MASEGRHDALCDALGIAQTVVRNRGWDAAGGRGIRGGSGSGRGSSGRVGAGRPAVRHWTVVSQMYATQRRRLPL